MIEKFTLFNMLRSYKDYQNKTEKFQQVQTVNPATETILGLTFTIFIIMLSLNLGLWIWALAALISKRKSMSDVSFWGCVGLLILSWNIFPLIGSILVLVIAYNSGNTATEPSSLTKFGLKFY